MHYSATKLEYPIQLKHQPFLQILSFTGKPFPINQKFMFLHCFVYLINARAELTAPSSKDMRTLQTSVQEEGL